MPYTARDRGIYHMIYLQSLREARHWAAVMLVMIEGAMVVPVCLVIGSRQPGQFRPDFLWY